MINRKKLNRQTKSGVSWNLISSVSNQVGVFILGIILANLLEPKDFGLITMIIVFTGFARILQEMGFNIALIQKKDLTEDHKNSVFWFNIVIGLIAALSLFIAMPFIAEFYDEPMINKIMPFLIAVYIINATSMVHFSMLKKELKFKIVSMARLAASLLAMLVAVILAFLGYGVWALVVQAVLGQVILTIVFLSCYSWRPKFTFKVNAIKDLLKFSINHFGSKSLNYWVKKTDSLLIGKFLGSSDLGIYNKAYRFLALPSSTITSNIASVLVSSFSIAQDDHEYIRENCIKLTRLSGFVITPIMIALIFTSENFVLGLLGEQWSGMIPILKFFAISSIPMSIFFPGAIFVSQNRTDLQFKVNLFTKILTIGLIIIGISYGIYGVAIAAALGTFIDWSLSMYIAGNLISLNFFKLIKSLIPAIIISVVIGYSCTFVGNQYFNIESHFLKLCLYFAMILSLYMLTNVLLKDKSYLELKKIGLGYLQKKTAKSKH